jgi:pyruvate/2-oxoglutarate dehydrogenase complex dihydrolipoamide acyltransferase (E2) component
LRSLMTLTLSVDHRFVDGAGAAGFLADLKVVLEEPALLAW